MKDLKWFRRFEKRSQRPTYLPLVGNEGMENRMQTTTVVGDCIGTDCQDPCIHSWKTIRPNSHNPPKPQLHQNLLYNIGRTPIVTTQTCAKFSKGRAALVWDALKHEDSVGLRRYSYDLQPSKLVCGVCFGDELSQRARNKNHA